MKFYVKFFLLSLFLCSSFAYAFELTIIQGISNTKQTFITRNGKKDGVFVGKKATFTSDNVSVIAQAIAVSREFTQWELMNNYTLIPFKKGDVVTYYNTTEYLWALTPEKIKSKYIKSKRYVAKESLGFHTSLTQALKESVSTSGESNAIRGGMQMELYFEKEINPDWSWAAGARFTRENIQLPEATLSTDRLMGILELRYFFPVITNFYNSRFGIALGAGYGQSQTNTTGLVSSGFATILPSTKINFNLPIDEKSQIVFESAFESINVEESFDNDEVQTTNMSVAKFGFAYKRYINL